MSLLICFVFIHYKGIDFNRNFKSRNLDCVCYNMDFVTYGNIEVLFHTFHCSIVWAEENLSL